MRSPAAAVLAALLLSSPLSAALAPEAAPSAVGTFIAEEMKRHEATPYAALIPPRTKLVSATLDPHGNWQLTFNANLADRAWLPESISALKQAVAKALEVGDPNQIQILVDFGEVRGRRSSTPLSLEELSFDPAQTKERQDAIQGGPAPLAAPVVDRMPADLELTGGLQNAHLVVAGSHGLTWHKEDRWQFQRSRLFTTIEDLFPTSYVNPFLMPMLENAGGVVFNVRERDTQIAEVIVDNDGTYPGSRVELSGSWSKEDGSGWRGPRPASLGPEDLPFTWGTTETSSDPAAKAVFTPFIPRTGRYAVYASWKQDPNNSPSVPVTIRHRGGETTLRVNQQVAGATWVFLGFWEFESGTDAEKASVTFSSEGAKPAQEGGQPVVSIDAVRFGGGMGNTAPEGLISGAPRYLEGSRYYLQYAGAPKEEYLFDASEGHFGPEYTRDYAGRATWPNYLQNHKGVPIDLFLSWHTDAGHDPDGIIGTLSIYRVQGDDGVTTFTDGRSRWMNRDFATLIHSEIERTAQSNYTSTWKMRDMRNGNYAESRKPDVPSVLLELMSHQNFHDMQYGLDPRFQFDISRAIYKAMVRFVAATKGYEPIIQPLAPTHVSALFEGDAVKISWRPQEDPLEPSATPDSYYLQVSTDGVAFDDGRRVEGTSTTFTDMPTTGTMYFRVIAANGGGLSFPSTVVGVGRADGDQDPVLIVDGFDRVSAPAKVITENARGFLLEKDPGLGYREAIGVVGPQYDFDPKSEWKNDLESPGRGASQSGLEGRPIPGNTFDHIVAHGEAIAAAGRSFESTTAAAFSAGEPQGDWELIDWIAGLQGPDRLPQGMTKTGMPDRMKHRFASFQGESAARLAQHLEQGGKLLISGPYVRIDAFPTPLKQYMPSSEYLFEADAPHMVVPAEEWSDVPAFRYAFGLEPRINLLERTYPVTRVSLGVVDEGAKALLTYPGASSPDVPGAAAILKGNVLWVGFPLETILPRDTRNAVFASALEELSE